MANEDSAKIISDLRHEIWKTTYRGIYSNERIDNYDYKEHRQRDLQRIQDISYNVYLINDIDISIGYFVFTTTVNVYIQSLYISQKYQRHGIGKQVFLFIKDYCQAHEYDKFTCNCNSHNFQAQKFYHYMGGVIIKRDEGHDDKYDDQITFEFCV